MDAASSHAIARVRRNDLAWHANPWSAWTRCAPARVVLAPVWTRRWPHAAVEAGWFAINPVLFPDPADQRASATRAMLGEEPRVDQPRSAGLGVNAAASAAGIAVAVAAARHRLVPTAVGTAAQMALLLVRSECWRHLHRHQQAAGSARGSAA